MKPFSLFLALMALGMVTMLVQMTRASSPEDPLVRHARQQGECICWPKNCRLHCDTYKDNGEIIRRVESCEGQGDNCACIPYACGSQCVQYDDKGTPTTVPSCPGS